MDWAYIGSSVAWSLLGAIIGYPLGRWSTKWGRRKRERTMKAEQTGSEKRRTTVDYLLAVGVFVVALGSVAYTAYGQHLDERQNACQAAYNDQVRLAVSANRAATKLDRDSLVRLVQEVTVSESREQTTRALQGYLRRVTQADKLRADQPVPELSPAQACPASDPGEAVRTYTVRMLAR